MADTNIDLGQWLGKMYTDYTGGRAKKDVMFGKGVSALESYADIFKPGGEYGAGVEAMIGRGEKKAVASGMQNLVSAGLANTTMPMHLAQTYEEEIGMPTRLRAEDTRMERLGGAMSSLGQMYAGYDPGSATAGDIAHMATGGFGTMMSGRLADMRMQQEMRDRQAANQAGLRSQQMFGGGAGSGSFGGTGTSGGGGYTAGQDWGYGDVDTSNPYGGGNAGVRNTGDNIMAGLYDADRFTGGLGTATSIQQAEADYQDVVTRSNAMVASGEITGEQAVAMVQQAFKQLSAVSEATKGRA
jgi:hypothetical protein